MKCQAPIDPKTKIALKGAFIEAALSVPDFPRCGCELRDDDDFCPSCGARIEWVSRHDSTAANAAVVEGQIRKTVSERASRSEFWPVVIGCFLISFLLSLLWRALAGVMNGMFLTILGAGGGLRIYVQFIKISVRRLHDMDCDGSLIILMNICLAGAVGIFTVVFNLSVGGWVALIGNLAMVILLGFKKGTQGPNAYGPDPLAYVNVLVRPEKATAKEDNELVSVGKEPILPPDDQELDGYVKSCPTCDVNANPSSKPHAKFIVLLSLAIVSVICSLCVYYSQQEKKNNDMFDRQVRVARYGQEIEKRVGSNKLGQPSMPDIAKARPLLGVPPYNNNGLERDKNEAIQWCSKVDQEDARNHVITPNRDKEGRDVEEDEAEVVKRYRKTAEQGIAEAQFILGFCYDNGRGVGQDKKEAAKWYRKAAEQGDGKASYYLGEMCENGLGVEKNEAEAVKWYRKAAENGDEDAKTALRRLGVDSE